MRSFDPRGLCDMLDVILQTAVWECGPPEGSIMSTDIARRILEHFRKGGTLQDRTVDALYRSAHGLGPEAATETEAVRRWAYDVASRLNLKAAALNETARMDVRSTARRGK